MATKVMLKRLNDAFHLQAVSEEGLTVEADATPEIGGQHKGMRPMQMLLASLGSCSAIDVIELLRKQRQPLEDMTIEVSGERATEVPRVFTAIHVQYKLYGNLEEKKVERACRLSMEKMCSVAKMLEKAAPITWAYEILPLPAPGRASE